MAIFKPLVGPLRYRLEERGDDLLIGLEPVDRAIEIPASLALFDVVYLMTLLRATTATPLTPLRVTAAENDPRVSAFVGCTIEPGPGMTLLLSAEDAARPLVTRNAAMWQIFEPHLRVALADELVDALLEETRTRLAKRYLSATGVSLKEIPYLLGYEGPSSFFRAYRGSTGQTPLEFRSAAALAGERRERV